MQIILVEEHIEMYVLESDNGNKYLTRIINPKSKKLNIESFIRLSKEINISKSFKHPNILEIQKIKKIKNSYELYYNYADLVPLQTIKLSYDEILKISIAILEALSYVHGHKLLHKDIRPSNILISPDKKNIKITGLGEIYAKDLKSKNELSQKFAYMSPEQSGMLKQIIDERSDLYSFGILLYELFNNSLPYTGNTINEIISSHLKKKPKKLSNIPEILNNIIFKLIEKELTNRYQSANGVKKDILRLINGEQDFVLGSYDKSIKLDYIPKFIGRDDEINKLREIYYEGKGCISYIYGESGIGKTTMAEELKKTVELEKGIFLGGKCFSNNSGIPYEPFKNIMNMYLQVYRNYTKEEKEKKDKELLEELGDLGGIILNFHPRLSEIFPKKKYNILSLDIEKGKKRFLMTIKNFFQIICKNQRTVIFLDDLQWADKGTIELITELSYGIDKTNILLLMTYRTNEINIDYIRNIIAKTQKEKYSIPIKNFDQARLDKLVSYVLHDRIKNIKDISAYTHSISKGNPYFAIQIIKELVESNCIHYKNNKWNMNKEKLEKISIPETLIDLIIYKLSKLGEEEKKLFSYFTMMGEQIDIDRVLKLTKIKKEDVFEIIDKGIKLQILERDENNKNIIRFFHDRVRESVQNIIKRKEKKNFI